jgi:uncharacterized protein YdiU (UPF0061 family)
MMLKKLGLSPLEREEDAALIDESARRDGGGGSGHDPLLPGPLARRAGHRLLAQREPLPRADRGRVLLTAPKSGHESLAQWLHHYAQRLGREGIDAEAIRETMLGANPKYVLRNYLAQQAIEATEGGDLSVLETLMQVLQAPYAEQPEHDELAAKRPEWARDRPGMRHALMQLLMARGFCGAARKSRHAHSVRSHGLARNKNLPTGRCCVGTRTKLLAASADLAPLPTQGGVTTDGT